MAFRWEPSLCRIKKVTVQTTKRHRSRQWILAHVETCGNLKSEWWTCQRKEKIDDDRTLSHHLLRQWAIGVLERYSLTHFMFFGHQLPPNIQCLAAAPKKSIATWVADRHLSWVRDWWYVYYVRTIFFKHDCDWSRAIKNLHHCF